MYFAIMAQEKQTCICLLECQYLFSKLLPNPFAPSIFQELEKNKRCSLYLQHLYYKEESVRKVNKAALSLPPR